MKQFLIDLLLVLLLLCVVSIFFDDHQVSKTVFQRSINDFEQNISMNKEVGNDYVVLQDTSDNQVSSFLKVVSDGCIQLIQYIVLIFSDFVSMIFMIVIY